MGGWGGLRAVRRFFPLTLRGQGCQQGHREDDAQHGRLGKIRDFAFTEHGWQRHCLGNSGCSFILHTTTHSIVVDITSLKVRELRARPVLRDWIPKSCSALTVFISYSHEHRPIAEEIAQTLKNSGHKVFFDKDSLPPGTDYNERIRDAIGKSERCIFLASNSAFLPGKYTLTELEFIKRRFPSPVGTVFPVIVEPDFPPEKLPPYLKSVQSISIQGSVVAETAAAIDGPRRLNKLCLTCLCAPIIVMLIAGGILIWRLQPPPDISDVALTPISNAHFRPLSAPPENVLASNAATDWLESPVTLTMDSIALINHTAQALPANLESEDTEVNIGSISGHYRWAYIVEFTDVPCKDWLCIQRNVSVETIQPGNTTGSREIMFLQTSAQKVAWKDFIDQVLDSNGPLQGKVTFSAKLIMSGKRETAETKIAYDCNIDVAAARESFVKVGFKPARNPRPVFWNPICMPK